jgi:hypothetical protein
MARAATLCANETKGYHRSASIPNLQGIPLLAGDSPLSSRGTLPHCKGETCLTNPRSDRLGVSVGGGTTTPLLTDTKESISSADPLEAVIERQLKPDFRSTQICAVLVDIGYPVCYNAAIKLVWNQPLLDLEVDEDVRDRQPAVLPKVPFVWKRA